jgi:Uma2 family endonuclease
MDTFAAPAVGGELMATATLKRVTFSEFLATVGGREERYELLDGVITGMVGGTVTAGRIAGNIFGHLFAQLRGGRCIPFGGNVLLYVNELDTFSPDAMVVCHRPDGGATHVTDPTVVIEVLSPDTEKKDRGYKWLRYRTIPALRHYLMVAQDARRVEVLSRDEGGAWTYRVYGDEPGARIDLAPVEAALTLDEIYEGVGSVG